MLMQSGREGVMSRSMEENMLLGRGTIYCAFFFLLSSTVRWIED